MALGNSDGTKLLDDLRREFVRFASSYTAAAKSGANEASKQIFNTLGDVSNPADIPSGKLFAAVKTGVRHASEHMIKFGMEYFKQMNK
ncbi:hypothetical protein D3P08_06720 [Paenibacillus nanensis]|uniref:Uncharacterized protein n=1 Tax=Paenibacillus nanensis TaxID=393251 RepID=A0A3A1V089_9BACL|nr:hypothetical protein [Paenibacillus nanensis]RIX53944.1 hypothetical protein D3P08_06720 [Paenibacillus nanensis]